MNNSAHLNRLAILSLREVLKETSGKLESMLSRAKEGEYTPEEIVEIENMLYAAASVLAQTDNLSY